MLYKRDCHILLMLLVVVLYLWFRMLGMFSEVFIYTDHLILMYILFCIWVVVYNHRLYVMTRKRLCNMWKQVGDHCQLEYKTYEHLGIIERIFVRVSNENYPNWYELDYTLCNIPKGTCTNVFNTFRLYNTTVSSLLHTMNSNANDKLIGEKYDLMKCDYGCFRWLTCLFLVLFYAVYIVILMNFVYSVEEVDRLFILLGL